MNHRSIRLLTVGTILLLISVGLSWFGFTTHSPSPVPSLSALAIAVVLFILALFLISRSMRGVESMGSTPPLRKFGNIVLVIGSVGTIYAAVAFFLVRSLPPNDGISRLPSLYLLFATLSVMFVGAVVRNFRLR